MTSRDLNPIEEDDSEGLRNGLFTIRCMKKHRDNETTRLLMEEKVNGGIYERKI